MCISVSQLELLSEQIQLKAPSFVVTTINQNKHIHAHLYPMFLFKKISSYELVYDDFVGRLGLCRPCFFIDCAINIVDFIETIFRACGITFTANHVVCGEHFASSDLIGGAQRTHLMPNSVPTLFIKPPL
ncbi:uncharacterized protein LOC118755554 [Rhagoletis pomonella]|uniref:uncharacterized protein LOC118755554 n=1 Tax=Rhagoletis pomonella TaxID=28610 RepID=UPI001781E34C|nr:uncharacterized protein LOC118755554 [Rhagoletis pomonella]